MGVSSLGRLRSGDDIGFQETAGKQLDLELPPLGNLAFIGPLRNGLVFHLECLCGLGAATKMLKNLIWGHNESSCHQIQAYFSDEYKHAGQACL
jgi:hypothetical protein